MAPGVSRASAIALSALLPILPSSGFCRTTLSVSSQARTMSLGAQNVPERSTSPPPSPSPAPPEPRKSHCTTVCAVPPPSATEAWGALTRARLQLRDPGFYRWPPHANLLYPFLELKSMKKRSEGSESEQGPLFDDDMLDALERVAAKCHPFEVTISELGTFGNKNRGVLWAYPRSHAIGDEPPVEGETSFCDPDEPLIQLQSLLEAEFPTCTEQRKSRDFHPHITLSHYASVDEALHAKEQIETWWTAIRYTTDEIYVLRRVGDEGQFEISATVCLARDKSNSIVDDALTTHRVQVHDPPVPFPDMPKTEEEWVYEERMKLKARRNNSWKTRGRKRAGRKRRNGRNKERVPDTPEIIAEKRAARKAKREALAAEAAAAAAAAAAAEAGDEST